MASVKSYYTKGIKYLKGYTQDTIDANNKATNKYIKQTNSIYDEAAKHLGTAAKQNKEKLNQDYQSAYDLNAVNKLVAERQLKEKMANSGLSDSGLNRSQQTAIATQKMNADNAVNQKKAAAKSSIEQGLANSLQQNEASRTSAISSAQLQNEQNNNNIKNSMYKSAYESAISMKNADKEANAKVQAAKIKADKEAEVTNEKIFNYAQKLYNTDKTNGGDMTFDDALSAAEKYLTGDTTITPKKTEKTSEIVKGWAMQRYVSPTERKNIINEKFAKGEITEAEAAYLTLNYLYN